MCTVFSFIVYPRSALKRREWERRNQEVQQDEDLFSTGFNLFGEPYKTNKGDALASRVQNTLGSYEEMKDLLTSHSNQSHLVGIPKGSTSLQPPCSTTSSSSTSTIPHQTSKKSRSSMDWSRGGHGQSTQGPGLVLGLGQNSQGQAAGPATVLTTPTPGLTTPTSGLTTPTFPPGNLSGKPVAVQQKPTAYVRPMDGQDQAPSDSPQLKPPLVTTEGFNSSSQTYGGNSGNVKNKLPKLSLSHTGEEMTHSWPPPLTAIHTPGKADQTKFPIPNKVDVYDVNQCNHGNDSLEGFFSPLQPEPPSTNKWQLDSWLNKVQAQTKPLVPPQQEHHGTGQQICKDVASVSSIKIKQKYKHTLNPHGLMHMEIYDFIYLLSVYQDKRKHRGPSTRITPKSREFIETDSSSSSSECQSDSEEAIKIPALSSSNSSISSSNNGSGNSCNSLSISNISGSFGTSVPDPGGSGGQCKDLESMSPPSNMGHEVPLSPLREYPEIQSLWVKIDLSLLNRVPSQGLAERSRVGLTERDGSEARDTERPLERTGVAERERQKQEDREWPGLRERQKLTKGERHEEENERLVSSLNRKQSRRRNEKLLPPLLSPLSDDAPRKRTCEGSSSLSQEVDASGVLPCSATSTSSSSSSSHRHRRGEAKVSSHARNVSVSAPTRCVRISGLIRGLQVILRADYLPFADYYMQEAKRLKHKADALMDKFGKAVNYADGALSFIECGNAMERDPLEAKSPYTMYSETVELIRYAMRLKNFTSHSSTVAEKKLTVLCNRCLSLLYLRMFHLKKDHAVKYSRSLMEYFKNSAKSSHQAPSPWRTNGKVNGTPSPLSLSPSPAGSGGAGATGSLGSVAIPQRIHHMAASHVNITNNILRSYEHWEMADRLATDNFFQELDSVMEPLSQQSSMTELVRYIRQGLHWLRIEAHLL
uniref:AF4/FMR2 family, member 2 n=1 Tax=Echeneis naucrates TaxID=173247 RepID=A0A665TC70_ECHNA